MFGAEKVTVNSVPLSVSTGEAMREAATICNSNFKVRENNRPPGLCYHCAPHPERHTEMTREDFFLFQHWCTFVFCNWFYQQILF